MPAPIRSGIVGTGFMGQVHARAVRAAGGVVAAVSSRSGGPSVEELIDSVDLVHVCTPNHLHREITEKALAAGRHVICEKPLGVDAVETAELVRRAEEAAVVTAVPFVYRFYPTVRSARDRVSQGGTGAVRLLHGSYLQDWLSRPGDDNWRVDPTVGGASRAFADIGVHWCDLAEFVTGHRIARLTARLVPGSRPTEDGATVMFETDGGALGTVVVSQVSPGRKNRLWLSVDGAEASLQFDQELPDTLWVGGREQSELVARGSRPGPYDIVPVGHPQGYQDCFTAFVGDVHAAIEGTAPAGLPSFADGHRAAVITDAVLRSAARRSWVEVPT